MASGGGAGACAGSVAESDGLAGASAGSGRVTSSTSNTCRNGKKLGDEVKAR